MSDGRRYQDHEVRQILDLAIGRDDAPTPAITASDGLTLRQLQDVGSEVGLTPSRISEVVALFESRRQVLPQARTLGLPTSVGSVVSLPRNFTDHEWERVVAELRTTFGAMGVVTGQGNLREWSNGKLHAFVEPTETGYRLRLTDDRAAELGVGALFGGVFMALGLMIFVALLGRNDLQFKFLVPLFFVGGGGGVVGLVAKALPRWARTQEQRMEHIGNFAVKLLAGPA